MAVTAATTAASRLHALSAKLPEEAKSLLVEPEFYDKYLYITLTTLQTILANSSVTMATNPKLIYCHLEHVDAFFYVFDIKFNSTFDDTLSVTTLERNEVVPVWIVVLRQQLIYVDVLACDPQDATKYRIFIDFRRITAPHWVKEKNVSRTLEGGIDFQKLLRAQYAELSNSLDSAVAANMDTAPITMKTTPPTTPKPAAKVAHAPPKQQSIRDLFGLMKKQAAPPPPAAKEKDEDAMDIDELPPPTVDPKREAILQALLQPQTEDHKQLLTASFEDFFHAVDHPSYTSHRLYLAYTEFIVKITDMIHMATDENTTMVASARTLFLTILNHGAQGYEASIHAEGGNCMLTNAVVTHGHLIQMHFKDDPHTTRTFLVDQSKLQLIDTLLMSGVILKRTVDEKVQLLKQPHHSQIYTKCATEWTNLFLMTTLMLNRLITQLFNK